MTKKNENKILAPRIENRKARHDYHIVDRLEVGIILQGSEVKSIRHGEVSLGEGFARIEPKTMELFLYNVNIAPYRQAMGNNGHEPTRPRKLLAHRREIDKLFASVSTKGTTLVPLAMYFVRGKVKIEIGVGEGKQGHDKRQDIKTRDADREMKRAMSRKVMR
jgi:SsrA-binding protein